MEICFTTTTKNQKTNNESSSFNNYDKDNPEKNKFINKNKNDNNTRSTLKKNIFKLKEILKIADNDKKQNHLKFNLKSLKSGIKK